MRSRSSGWIAGLLALVGMWTTPVVLAESEPVSILDAEIGALIAGIEGRVSIYARNLDSGREFGINADERVRTASTIKLPIACALAREVAARRARWDERLTIRARDKVSGSGVLAEFSDGARVSLRDAMTLMLVVSDNTATNLILDRIGTDTVNDAMSELGLAATRSMRKIRGDGTQLKPAEGWSRVGRQPGNDRFGIGASTPREMVRLLERLERGEVVDRVSSALILDTLKRQQYKDGIGRRVTEWTVASKSGSLDALRSDVGIVYTPAGRIAIAITIDDMPTIDYSPDNVGEKAISAIAQRLIAHMQ